MNCVSKDRINMPVSRLHLRLIVRCSSSNLLAYLLTSVA